MRSSLKTSTKTLPLTVHRTGFLLDRMGQDCHPLQFLRELTQNAIEAIHRTPEGRGEVVWDVDWTSYALEDGIYRLCIIDTGDGMTGDEMVKYLNQLSSSVAQQSMSGNYGVGAKIAAATRNHAGLIYLSWKHGDGSMIHLWRDPSGEYGLRQFERPDGTFGHYGAVDDAVKPDQIGDHGTMIVLYGNSDREDTMKAPEGASSPSRWIAKYLNSRYFDVPEGVSLRAREGWEYPRTDTDRNLLRKVMGQAEYLSQHSESSGIINLTKATAHWWILKEESAISQNSGYIESAGHIAALYQGELYELATARSGAARLQQFGVIMGYRRVVIYVEPVADSETRITTNTARTHLLLNNEAAPWAEWAAEFRDQLPDEIDRLIQEVASHASSSDQSQSIRDRLKEIMDIFKVSRYRVTPSGDAQVDETRRSRGAPAQRGESVHTGSTTRSGSKGGTAGGVYSVFLKKEGAPGKAARPDVFPAITWVSTKDGTREPLDMEDRAARYLVDQNRLLVNGDFRAFTDMVERWTNQYGSKPGVQEVVQDSVRSWFAQALVETVLGIQALKDSKEWSIDSVEKALSEEGLTAAVMSRYHVNNSVKRELGTKLGKLQMVEVR